MQTQSHASPQIHAVPDAAMVTWSLSNQLCTAQDVKIVCMQGKGVPGTSCSIQIVCASLPRGALTLLILSAVHDIDVDHTAGHNSCN